MSGSSKKTSEALLGAVKESASIIVRGVRLLLWGVYMIIVLFSSFLSLIAATVDKIRQTLVDFVAKAMPKPVDHKIDSQLMFAGMDMSSEELVSITLIYSVLFSVAAYLFATVLALPQTLVTASVLGCFTAVWLSPIVIVNLLIMQRTLSIEEVLPDVLVIVSQNMASGMTSYNSLWSAARPEFGPIAVELQQAAKATLTGLPLTEALYGITRRVKSERLARTIRLIIQGINSGGNLPEVLSGIAEDMRTELNLGKAMRTETRGHVLFILFALLIGSPLLLGISYQFISIFSALTEKIGLEEITEKTPEAMLMFNLSGLSVSPEFFQTYSIVVLTVSSVLGAFLVGLLQSGRLISGAPNIPVFTFISVMVFFGIKFLLGKVFAGMLLF
ncbi:MAG: hypothetical protein GF334_09560 [Candidatus Altiarchaeales archaeon]|nr:hypothetical protein [Candidatus Altiarchaeales archaeon]